MKIKSNNDGTFTLENLTPDQLAVVFHSVNVATYVRALREPFREAANTLFDEMSQHDACYRGPKVHKQFAEAMTKVV